MKSLRSISNIIKNVKVSHKHSAEYDTDGQLFRNSGLFRCIYLGASVLVCAAFSILNYQNILLNPDNTTYKVGYTWTSPTLKASRSFPVYKPHIQYRADVHDAIEKVPAVFVRDNFASENLEAHLIKISQAIEERNDTLLLEFSTRANVNRFFSQSKETVKNETDKLIDKVLPEIKEIYEYGYIDRQKDRFGFKDVICVSVGPQTELFINKETTYDKERFSNRLQKICNNIFNDKSEPMFVDLMFKLVNPNLAYSATMTREAEDIAEQGVKKTIKIINNGEIIVKRGERLTEENINTLESYFSLNQINSEGITTAKIFGEIGNAIIYNAIFFLFIMMFRKRIYANNLHLLILCGCLMMTTFLGWLSSFLQTFNANIPFDYLIPIPAFAMFITVIFDVRTAFYVTVSMSLALAGVRGNDYFLCLTMLFTGFIATYSVRNIEDRRELFASVVFIFIGFVVSILAVDLERGFTLNDMFPQLFLSLINAILAPVVTFLLLMLVDKFSKNITTSLKLMDLIKHPHPLIKQMQEVAPATYAHSVEIAELGEAIATSINANGLLVAAGAKFHDIGKILHPEYFTENTDASAEDSHQKLTPEQSASVIIRHVTDGEKLAHENNLPKGIINFILQHHGTSLVKHFYNVACNNAKDNEVVDEAKFRYPGPRPQCKETAILMLCDNAEAISKSAPDWETFVKIYESMIDERIKDGQFNDSELTLGDIKTIKEILYTEMKGRFHTRTQYAELNTKK